MWPTKCSTSSSLYSKITDLGGIHLTGPRHGFNLAYTERNRCSIAQAVWYEPISSTRFKLNAEIPSLPVANSQHAVNHTVSGVRVRSKIVPAVTELRVLHTEHLYRPSPRRQPSSCPHVGQMKPSGHRNHSR